VGTLIPILTLLVVVALGLLITRIGTVALKFTGLSHELAHFQALSAFMGVGFTTEESEQVLSNPVRRRIIRWLILLGNAGFVAAISAIIPIFVTGKEDTTTFWLKLAWLASGLALLWVISASKWVDRQMSRAIGWALKHWTRLEVYDYQGLLQLSEGYAVSEMKVEPDDWVAGKSLVQIRLADEGVQVLGMRRSDGEFVGAPTGRTYIRRGDTLILYGKVEHLAELDRRRADPMGDKAHQQRVQELQQVVTEQVQHERHAPEGIE
jgi:K+/H+ antiporter YhaU regulatory subunit KhtT